MKKRLTKEELVQSLKEDYKEGFQFKIYVGIWRYRRYISEISGIKRLKPNGIAGFSWQACQDSQEKLRRIEKALLFGGIPIEYVAL